MVILFIVIIICFTVRFATVFASQWLLSLFSMYHLYLNLLFVYMSKIIIIFSFNSLIDRNPRYTYLSKTIIDPLV